MRRYLPTILGLLALLVSSSPVGAQDTATPTNTATPTSTPDGRILSDSCTWFNKNLDPIGRCLNTPAPVPTTIHAGNKTVVFELTGKNVEGTATCRPCGGCPVVRLWNKTQGPGVYYKLVDTHCIEYATEIHACGDPNGCLAEVFLVK